MQGRDANKKELCPDLSQLEAKVKGALARVQEDRPPYHPCDAKEKLSTHAKACLAFASAHKDDMGLLMEVSALEGIHRRWSGDALSFLVLLCADISGALTLRSLKDAVRLMEIETGHDFEFYWNGVYDRRGKHVSEACCRHRHSPAPVARREK